MLVWWCQMMDRAEAIRILDPETTVEALTEIEYYNGFSGRTAGVQAVYDAIDIAVADMRAQEQSQWISVKERLPECGKDVLVMRSNSIGNMAVWRLYCPVSNGQFYWEDEIGDGLMLKAATHWMPLPEPPKGE